MGLQESLLRRDLENQVIDRVVACIAQPAIARVVKVLILEAYDSLEAIKCDVRYIRIETISVEFALYIQLLARV